MNRWIIKILVLLSLLSAGCQDDGLVDKVLPVEQPEQAERALITLQGVVGTGPATRTQIDGNRFSWLGTDTIGVFYSAASDTLAAPFVVHSLSEDGSTAVFVSLDSLDWRIEDGGYLHAYYPWREGDSRTLTMTVDSVQEQTDAIASHTGRFDYMLADSVGYALPATTLHFRHLVALTDLIFRNTGTEEIGFDSLMITSPQAAWPVQGTIDLLHPAAGVQSIAQATTLKTRVKDGAVTVAPGSSLAVRVVMMPADLSAETMTIRVYTSAGDTLFTKPGLNFRAGKRYIMRLSSEEDDFDRLMAFYRATGGDSWTNNTNWCSDRPLSEWYGVTCDENGRVTRLELGGNNLSGEIPAAIGGLTELTSVNLGSNHLSGTIPLEIAQLTKLSYLNLGWNQFSGSIPPEWARLTNLYNLYLMNNNLEGTLPKELGQLTKLRGLSVQNNRLIGELPAEIKALPNWSNFSSSVIPQQEGYGFSLPDDPADRAALLAFYEATGGANWTNNTNWGTDVSTNLWYGVTCDENGKVTRLNLGGNGLSGSIPAIINELTELTYIDLWNNQLSGTIPVELAQLTKLNFLSLSNNKLTGPIPVELCSLTNLSSLYLMNNNLEGTLPKELGQLTKLNSLGLSNNRFTGEIPAEITALPNWSNFSPSSIIPQQEGYGFSLADDAADRNALMAFYEATGGVTWTNNTNWGSDKSVNQWYGVTCDENGKVTRLNLTNNGLFGFIPPAIGELTELTSVVLENNRLSGTIPVEFAQLTKLSTLNLGGNRLSGTIPVELCSLTNLYQLYLSDNNLEGALSVELGQLTRLEYLQIQNNRFSGMIPVELGALTNLYGLDLRNNNLEGTLPSELGRLTRLAWLHLSGNRFTGEIPAEIKALPKWANFSVDLIIPQQDGYGFSLPEDAVDRNALVAFYEVTGGANWTNNTNWGSDKPLYQWYGVTCDENGKVTRLELGSNGLSGTIPPAIGELTELTSVNLSNNQLSGTIPVELAQLTKLNSLSLNSNQLSGAIPVALGTMTNLSSLDLGYNNLEGSLPQELGQLTNLGWLVMQNNRLTGEIPAEIKALPNWSNFSSSVIPQQDGYGFSLAGDAADRAALLAFYEATGGAAWTNNTNWGSDKSVNQWYGVTCDENGKVTRLGLDNNGLSGSIPAAIGELTELTNVFLGNNQLSGSLPVEIGQLSKLWQLYLNNNNLEGALPKELGQLTGLGYLDLSSNRFSGGIPLELGSLTNLYSLGLNNNNLEGFLPKELGQLTKLNSLGLSNNRFTGEIPAEITALPNWSNFSSEVIPQQDGYGFSLADDAADRNALMAFYEATGGAAWTNNTNWGSDKSVNQWYGVTCDENGKVTQLELSNNSLSGSIPAVIGELTELTSVVLENNQLSGTIPVELTRLTNLSTLNLHSNELTGFIPVELAQLTKLRYLYLGYNQFTGTIPVELAQLTNLWDLYLNNNNLEGALPVELGRLTGLGYLQLQDNRFSGGIPSEWGKMTSLYGLYLNNNDLEGTLPKELGQLTKLKSFILSNNRLTGEVPAEIIAIPNWQNFNPSASILPQQAGYGLTLPEGVQ